MKVPGTWVRMVWVGCGRWRVRVSRGERDVRVDKPLKAFAPKGTEWWQRGSRGGRDPVPP